MNITETIRAHAARAPDAPAYLRTRRPGLTYRQYDAILDAIAWRALDAGLRPGDRVAVAVERDFAQLAVVLALARAGIESFRPDTPDDACRGWIASRGALRPRGGRLLVIDPDWFVPPPAPRPVPMHPGGDANCCLFRTSGTTGRPKGVLMTHAMIAARVTSRLRSVALPSPLRLLSKVRCHASYGFQVSVVALWTGGTIVEPAEVDDLPAQIDRFAVNWLVAPPGALGPFIDTLPEGVGPFPTLRLVEVSGSKLSPTLARRAAERVSAHLSVLYGSTETGAVAHASIADLAGEPDSVGRVIAGIDVEIVDEAGRALPPGVEGFLRVRSPGMAHRYEDADAATPAFRDGWFHSGDRASLTEGGHLRVLGRSDERINVGGFKIAPEQVEAMVETIPGIAAVAAFAMPSASGIDRVGLAIVTGAGFDFEAFKAVAKDRMGILVPEVVLRVAAIPRNDNGKVERKALARLAAAHAPPPAARIATPD